MNESDELYKILWYYGLLPEYGQKIICPFHEDENPSLLVNFEKGTWYCFGCQKSGYAKDFVKYMNPGMNDLSAYREMLRIVKSETQNCHVNKRIIRRKRTSTRESYDISYDYYHGLSKVDWCGDYDSIEFTDVKRYMINRGFSAKVLTKVGAKLTYNISYPIIFPMLDNGKYKGYVCRTNLPAIEKKRKYLYNDGFSRSETLVGNYGMSDYVFVVEGYMDRLKFIQFGEENVVAILGWKMSREQEEKLKKAGVKWVISALDNDESGRKGTKYLKTIFPTVRFCYLKGIKDPGEMTEDNFYKMYKKTINVFNKERSLENGTVRQHKKGCKKEWE